MFFTSSLKPAAVFSRKSGLIITPMVLTQFQELVAQYYEILKDIPEFEEAQNIYSELHEVRKKLSEIEAERLQYLNDLAEPFKLQHINKYKL